MPRAETRTITTEGRPRLTKHLTVELARVSQRRYDLALLRLLNANLPAVSQSPACAVIVIVGIQRAEQAKEEALVHVATAEVGVLQNLGARCGGTTGYDKDRAVEVRFGSDLEVVALEVQAGDEVGEGGPETAAGVTDDFLVGADQADLGIVKGGEEGGQKEGLPVDMVVHADCYGGSSGIKSLAGADDLFALVGFSGLDHDEVGVGVKNREAVFLQNILDIVEELDINSGDDESVRLILQNRATAFEKRASVGRHGGDYDGDITVGVTRVNRPRRLVEEDACDEVDDETRVSEYEEEEEEEILGGETTYDQKENGENHGVLDERSEAESTMLSWESFPVTWKVTMCYI